MPRGCLLQSGRMPGGLVGTKSGVSLPVHCACRSSHHTSCLRSDHGLPVEVGRGAIVQGAPIVGPRERPALVAAVAVRPVSLPRSSTVVVLVRKDAAIHPAAAGRAAVVLQLLKALELLTVGDGVAVDLPQHRAASGSAVSPLTGYSQVSAWICASRGSALCGIELLQPLAEVIDEPQVGAAVAGRITYLVVPLHQPRGVCQRAFLLRRHRGGQKEDLGADPLRRAVRRAARGRPSARNSPSRSSRSRAPPAIPAWPWPRCTSSEFTAPTTGFWPSTNWPFTTPSTIGERHRQLRMVAGQFWQKFVSELIVLLRAVAVPGLQQRDHVFRQVVPPAGRHRLGRPGIRPRWCAGLNALGCGR